MNRRCQLLVSVQNANEAALARELGVPWIDLKNPALGSLGQPELSTAREVSKLLGASPSAPPCQSSVALGELRTIDIRQAVEIMQLFPVAKIGLAGLANSSGELNAADHRRLVLIAADAHEAVQLVVAIYADFDRAAAPAPRAVLGLAQELGSRYVLVDTCIKDGRGLFDWLSVQQLDELRESAAAIGTELVVAGSLRASDRPQLNELAPAIVGVRGDVCSTSTDRSSGLSTPRVLQWLEWTRAKHANDRATAPR